MYKGKRIAVVVPAYKEESQITGVVKTMPDFVDRIIIVDDASPDRTSEVVEGIMGEERGAESGEGRVALIRHEENAGVGAAIATGYRRVIEEGQDVAVVMAGDGQMDPDDLPAVLDPVVNDEADYSKGNRLFTGEAYKKIPKVRYLGNAVLSLFTKIASGYWHIADSQSGYTAINRRALEAVDWDQMYTRYGQPNDLLVMLNVFDFRVRDVIINPVYGVGEVSGIKIRKVIFTIGWLLLRRFIWRLKEKYVIRNFHPLVFFYAIGLMFWIATAWLSIRLAGRWFVLGHVPPITTLSLMFSFMSASLFTLFAMWFDMEENKHLR